jgi:long-chain fatty acid transport protein
LQINNNPQTKYLNNLSTITKHPALLLLFYVNCCKFPYATGVIEWSAGTQPCSRQFQSSEENIMVIRRSPLKAVVKFALPASMLLTGSGVQASGFGLIEQSVSSMGTAYANGSAGLDDPSTIWFNPATMTRLNGRHASGGAHVVWSRVDIEAEANYNPNIPLIGGSDISGDNNTDTDVLALVPHAAYSHQLNEKMWLGMSVNVPFGLETEYDDNWVGRYHAIKSELLTVNFNPSIAFRFNDRVSAGLGVSAVYADGKLTNAVDGGLSAFASGSPIPGWVPGSSTFDHKAELQGDDWGYGWNAGLMLQPTEQTRFGLQYRSKIDLDISGDVEVSGPIPSPDLNFKDDAELSITLPASWSISAYHDLSDRFAIMADVTWTEWSELDEIRIKQDSGAQTLGVWDWDDTIRYSVGGSYRFNHNWLLRTGVAFDQGATPSDRLRTPRVPDDDRIWFALGANYKYSEQMSIDFGYAHLFVDDPELDNSESTYDPTRGQTAGAHLISGEYDAAVDMFSVQLNWKFN